MIRWCCNFFVQQCFALEWWWQWYAWKTGRKWWNKMDNQNEADAKEGHTASLWLRKWTIWKKNIFLEQRWYRVRSIVESMQVRLFGRPAYLHVHIYATFKGGNKKAQKIRYFGKMDDHVKQLKGIWVQPTTRSAPTSDFCQRPESLGLPPLSSGDEWHILGDEVEERWSRVPNQILTPKHLQVDKFHGFIHSFQHNHIQSAKNALRKPHPSIGAPSKFWCAQHGWFLQRLLIINSFSNFLTSNATRAIFNLHAIFGIKHFFEALLILHLAAEGG